MPRLSTELKKVIGNLDGDAAKFFKIAQNNERYKQAVRDIWLDDAPVELILAHTNAFYVRKDETPRKGPDKDKPYIVCEICADDPLVRSELDTHRELLQLALKKQGMDFEEIRIIPARRGMKNRHPFIKDN